jgi:hypothetical protein
VALKALGILLSSAGADWPPNFPIEHMASGILVSLLLSPRQGTRSFKAEDAGKESEHDFGKPFTDEFVVKTVFDRHVSLRTAMLYGEAAV